MPVPKHVYDPPFDIVRASHIALGVTDLARSRAFYEGALGLHVEDATKDAIYLRGVEERQHHSLGLGRESQPSAHHVGFKVASEEELDKAARYFRSKGIAHAFVERPFQGRTLLATDPSGMPIELYFRMERRERLLQQYGYYKGVHPQRLDHFNVFAPDVQGAVDFYASIGFRLTEYAEEDAPKARIAAAWMHRKGNVHDLAFTNGEGPRLHHLAYWVPTAMHIIHLCDLLATTGYLASMERGPGLTASPTPSSCMCAARMDTASSSTPATIRPWIPTTSPYAGRCAIPAGRRCGASPRRARGARRERPLPVRCPARRCSRPTCSSQAKEKASCSPVRWRGRSCVT